MRPLQAVQATQAATRTTCRHCTLWAVRHRAHVDFAAIRAPSALPTVAISRQLRHGNTTPHAAAPCTHRTAPPVSPTALLECVPLQVSCPPGKRVGRLKREAGARMSHAKAGAAPATVSASALPRASPNTGLQQDSLPTSALRRVTRWDGCPRPAQACSHTSHRLPDTGLAARGITIRRHPARRLPPAPAP